MSARHSRLIILGSGPAGYSAAVYAARANLKPTLIAGLQLGGQLTTTTEVDNWPGDPEGLTGPALMERMQAHAERFGTEIVYDHINEVNLNVRPFVLKGDMEEFTCDALIICTGATAQYLGLESEAAFMGQGVSACATCDGFFYRGKDIHVIGGGDSAIEEALYLTRFANSVTIIHRRDALRAGPLLERRARANAKIRFLWDTVVEEIVGRERVQNLRLRNVKTDQQFEVPTDGVFISIGHVPNNALIADQVELDKQGYVRIDWKMRTSVPGVFAAGEIADPHYRQIITSAAMGAAAALQADCYLNEQNP